MNLKSSNEIAAAWINVEPLLATKQRGDNLTRDEIATLATPLDVRRIEQRVRGYYYAKGIHLIPIVNVGWRLATAEEQVRDRAEHHRIKAYKETKRELHAAATAPEDALTAETRRLRDLHVRQASQRIGAHRSDETERKALLGAPAPRPMLK